MPGHLKRRGPGKFLVVVELPHDRDGKRRQLTKTIAGTRRDAERLLRQLLAEQDAGTLAESSRLTLAEFLACWLADEIGVSCKITTQELYARVIRKHLAPALGHVRLDALSPALIQRYYADGARAGLSGSTLHHHHTLLHSALATAVRWRLLPRNPADAVTAPKKAEPQPRAIPREQLLALLEAAAGTRQYLPILLVAGLGIRQGEILGLRWEDVRVWQDPKGTWRGLLVVERTLQRTAAGLTFGARKGKEQRSEFPLPPIVAEALAYHPESLARHREEWGSDWEEHGLVCPGERGRPWHPSSHRSGFYQLLRARGLPRLRFHDLRHSHATLLLLAGVPLSVVSKRLGHARQSTTLGIYSHVLPGAQEAASEVAEDLLRRAG